MFQTPGGTGYGAMGLSNGTDRALASTTLNVRTRTSTGWPTATVVGETETATSPAARAAPAVASVTANTPMPTRTRAVLRPITSNVHRACGRGSKFAAVAT